MDWIDSPHRTWAQISVIRCIERWFNLMYFNARMGHWFHFIFSPSARSPNSVSVPSEYWKIQALKALIHGLTESNEMLRVAITHRDVSDELPLNVMESCAIKVNRKISKKNTKINIKELFLRETHWYTIPRVTLSPPFLLSLYHFVAWPEDAECSMLEENFPHTNTLRNDSNACYDVILWLWHIY